MNKYLFFLTILFTLSCNQDTPSSKTILADSNGAIGQVTTIIRNLQSDSLRTFLNQFIKKPLVGVPQPENSYYCSYIPIASFTQYSKKNRLILHISRGNRSFHITKNRYAKPQRIITIKGSSHLEIIQLLEENKTLIFKTLKDGELNWKLKKMKKFKLSDKDIQENLDISMTIPKHYRYAKQTNNFFWLRRNTKKGSLNLVLFKINFKGALKSFDLSQARDSIGKKHIPGPKPNSYFSTEYDIPSFSTDLKINNKQALETRGLWQVKHDFMGGPFINYLIRLNKAEILYLEGFIYDPMERKKENLLELEAIMRSIHFDDFKKL